MIMRKPPSAPDAIGAPAKGGRGPFSCPKLTSVDGCRAHGLARLGDRYIALCRHAGSRLGAAAPDLVPAGGIGVGRGAAGRLDRGADTAKIGRAHVRTPVTHAHLVCRLLLEKKKLLAKDIKTRYDLSMHYY